MASCSVLDHFPHRQHRPFVTHLGLQLPSIGGIERKSWNFHKARWGDFTAATERSIPLIPSSSPSPLKKHISASLVPCKGSSPDNTTGIPHHIHTIGMPRLLKEYEKSGDTDVTNNLIDSLEAARQHHWEEATVRAPRAGPSSSDWEQPNYHLRRTIHMSEPMQSLLT